MCPVPFSAHQLNLARRGPVVMKFDFLTSEERLSEIKVAEDWGLESKPHDWNWGHVQGTRLHQLLERTKILLPRKEYLFNKFSHTVRETQKLPGDCPVYPSLWSNFTSKISFETPTSHGGHQFLCPLSILPGLSEWLSVPFKTELRQDEGQLCADLSDFFATWLHASRERPFSEAAAALCTPAGLHSASVGSELPAFQGAASRPRARRRSH